MAKMKRCGAPPTHTFARRLAGAVGLVACAKLRNNISEKSCEATRLPSADLTPSG